MNDDIILISKEKFDYIFDMAKKNSSPEERELLDKQIKNMVLIEKIKFNTLFTDPKEFARNIINEGLLTVLFGSSESNFLDTLKEGFENLVNMFKQNKNDEE
jgi:hypothetical protein